jgi:hypothetical protein
MSPLTCPDVADRIDLYAAGECDAVEAEAIRRHLAQCPTCASACEESRQLIGLIELRLQEPERLRRLQARIAAEAEPRRRVLRFPTAFRRVAALAAMLLLAVGPVGWLTQGLQLVEDNGGLVIAMGEKAQGAPEALPVPAASNVRAQPKDAARQLPVDLELKLHNTTDQPMRVWVAGPQTELRLDLRGPGAVSVPVEDRVKKEPQAVTLPPGAEETILRIRSLSDGRRSWHWTEPGDYTLTAQLTTRASAPGTGEQRIVVRSEPMTFHVPEK